MITDAMTKPTHYATYSHSHKDTISALIAKSHRRIKHEPLCFIIEI